MQDRRLFAGASLERSEICARQRKSESLGISEAATGQILVEQGLRITVGLLGQLTVGVRKQSRVIVFTGQELRREYQWPAC